MNSSIKLLAALILLLFASATFAAGDDFNNAKIKMSETYWHFGYVPTDVFVKHTYWIHNVGRDTLKILRVKPECGCTAAPLEKDVIPVGDSAKLEVRFNTEKMIGKMVKDISIKSNDPENPLIEVKFFASVRREDKLVKAEPNILRFPITNKNNYQKRHSFEIKNNSTKDVELEIIETQSDIFEIVMSRNKIKAGGSSVIDVRLINQPTTNGDITGSVTIEFATDYTDRITIPIIVPIQL